MEFTRLEISCRVSPFIESTCFQLKVQPVKHPGVEKNKIQQQGRGRGAGVLGTVMNLSIYVLAPWKRIILARLTRQDRARVPTASRAFS